MNVPMTCGFVSKFKVQLAAMSNVTGDRSLASPQKLAVRAPPVPVFVDMNTTVPEPTARTFLKLNLSPASMVSVRPFSVRRCVRLRTMKPQ